MVTNSFYSCVSCLTPCLSRLFVLPMRMQISGEKSDLLPPGFKPGTFHARGERDNHYAMERGHSLPLNTVSRKTQGSAATIQATNF